MRCLNLKRVFYYIRSKVFYKIFLIFVIIITVPVVCITFLSIRHSTNNIVKQVTLSSIENLKDRKTVIDSEIRKINDLAKNIVSNMEVRKLLNAKEIGYKERVTIANIIDYLKSVVYTNDQIESIYLYDLYSGRIIHDTYYTLDEFKDTGVFKLLFEKNYKIVRRDSPTGDTLSYLWVFNDLISSKQLYVVINIKYNRFFNIDPRLNASGSPGLFIFNDEYSGILLNSKGLETVDRDIMKEIIDLEDNYGILEINQEDYLVCRVRSDAADWNIVYLFPYYEIIQEAHLLVKLIVTSLIIVLALSFVLAYFSSLYLYKPLDRLVRRIESLFDRELDSAEKRNEYSFLDSAFNNMYERNRELLSKYNFALPYLKQYSVYDLLIGKKFDPVKFEKLLDLIGIRFDYSNYINVIIDFENVEFTEGVKEHFDTCFSKYGDTLKYLVSKVDNSRISVIINTEAEEDTIVRIMGEIKEQLNNNGIELTVFVGAAYRNIESVYIYFHELLRSIEVKFFEGKNTIITSNISRSLTGRFIYDKALEEQIITRIKLADCHGSLDLLDKLINRITESSQNMEYVKYAYFQVVYNILYILDYMGRETGELGMNREEIFDAIQKAETMQALRTLVEEIVSRSILLIENNKEEKHKHIIEKVLDYIHKNYSDSFLGLDAIANEVCLSPRYLNRIFKAEMGTTIYEYITKLRMDAATRLLTSTDYKVKKIAGIVGFNSEQSFLRLFKKLYSMTPLEYKKRNVTNIQ